MEVSVPIDDSFPKDHEFLKQHVLDHFSQDMRYFKIVYEQIANDKSLKSNYSETHPDDIKQKFFTIIENIVD